MNPPVRKYTYTVFFLMGLIFSAGCLALNIEYDSLLIKAESIKTSDPSGLLTYMESLENDYENFNSEQKNRFNLLMANSLVIKGHFKKAYKYLERVSSQVTPNKYRLRAFYLKATLLGLQGKFEDSFNHLFQALQLLEQTSDEEAQMTTLYLASSLHTQAEAYDDAVAYADRLLSFAKESGNQHFQCYGLHGKGSARLLQGLLDEALIVFREASSVCEQAKELIAHASSEKGLGHIMLKRGNYEQALNVLKPALERAENADFAPDVVHIKSLMAEAFVGVGDLESAEKHALEAISQAKTISDPRRVRDTSKVLAEISRHRGELNKALTFYMDHMEANQKVQNDLQTKHIAFQRTRFSSLDKSRQIELLNQQNKVLSLESSLAEQSRRNIQLIASFGLILLVFSTFWLVKTQRQKSAFKKLSEIDGLTGVANRRHAIARAEQWYEKIDGEFSVIIVDLDHFKKVNDTYGHASGDWVLQKVAEVVQGEVRRTDIFGRTGGEEFAIFLPSTPEEEACQLAERCRVAIGHIDTTPSGYKFPVSACFGIAGIKNKKKSLGLLMHHADEALYQAKDEGRNRICLYQPESKPEARGNLSPVVNPA